MKRTITENSRSPALMSHIQHFNVWTSGMGEKFRDSPRFRFANIPIPSSNRKIKEKYISDSEKKTTYYRDSYLPQFINQQLNVVACKFKQIFVSLRPKSTLNHECTNKNMFQQFYVQFPIKNKETHKLWKQYVSEHHCIIDQPSMNLWTLAYTEWTGRGKMRNIEHRLHMRIESLSTQGALDWLQLT